MQGDGAPPLLGDPEGSIVYGSPRCVYLADGRARIYAHRSTGVAGETTIICVDEQLARSASPASSHQQQQQLSSTSSCCSAGGGARRGGSAPPVLCSSVETVCIRQELPEETLTVYAPEVLRIPGGWRMFYAGWASSPTRGYILSATSPDGLTWTKDDKPVVSPGGQWDGVKCSEPCVFALPAAIGGSGGAGFKLLYEACDGSAEGATGVWRILGATKTTSRAARL
jgi:hypothetical protein|eukprot:COSAG01_NODE_75_length_28415_cov_72.253267_2_plen_226_part_00